MDEKILAPTQKSKFFVYFEKYLLTIGILSQLGFYSKAMKIFMTESISDVSLNGFLFDLISMSSWLIYGLLLKNRVLIISNLFAVIGAIFVLAGILIHGT